MAYLTLSENIVAALINAAAGDLKMQTGCAVAQLHAWQHKHSCHFGTCRSDVGASLHLLVFEDITLSNLCHESVETVDQLQLDEIVRILLSYKHWYANDEGAYWEKASTRPLAEGKGTRQSTSFRSFKLMQYLEQNSDQAAHQVLAVLSRLGLDDAYLLSCTRLGDCS